MNESSSSGGSRRGPFRWGIALILTGIALALLALMMWRLARPAEQIVVVPSPQAPPTFSNPAAGNHPPDGKLMPPTAETADYSNIPPSIEQVPVPERAAGDLDRLFTTLVPAHDYFATAQELGNRELGDRTGQAAGYAVGQTAIFQTADGPREAELAYMDDLATFWVETGLSLDQPALVAAAGRLRNEYYPILSRNFGQEWRPGIDGDMRFTVLHVLGATDTYQLGYFTDENQYPRSLFSQSNEREMIYLNMGQLTLGTPLYDGTLVHEVQHLIQWNLDANEDQWFNEGLSQIAEVMAGLDTVDPSPYLEQTNIRLDRWTEFDPEIYAHYGGAFLYLLYFWQQAGDAALAELARQPANGLAAVRNTLAGHLPELSLERFTADWATALFLDGKSADPRYNINGYALPRPFFANRVRQLPFSETATLDQYAIDYIDLDFRGRATLTFAGDTVTALTDEPPGGGPIWFAPPADNARSRLTAAADLSGLSNAELSFAAWYDLEPLYDFAYLSISTDDGATWRVLEPRHAIMGAYGPGWGGQSAEALDHDNNWVSEQIDLSAYTGKAVLLRFDVMTDFEAFGRGFALSHLTIPQLAEQPQWRPSGFVETGHILPQQWEVRLIRKGGAPEVLSLTLDDLNRGRIETELGAEGGALIIMPLTPFVESPADYWLSVER